MTTSDGISTDDWDVVHQLAVDLVNASDDEDDECRRRLLACLDKLESKYGPLPSILATRADYIDDSGTKEKLLKQAYASAESRDDLKNLLYIAHSFTELYVETRSLTDANHWLDRLRFHLDLTPDSHFLAEYASLSDEVARLRGPNSHE